MQSNPKPLRSEPKKHQGILLKTQKYDIEISYKPGSELYLADTLSRAFLPTSTNTQGEFKRINVVKLLLLTDERLAELKHAMQTDKVMQDLKRVIHSGWPEDKKDLPAVLLPYFNFRDELSVCNGLVFKGE